MQTIDTTYQFSEPRTINTRNGERIVRSLLLPEGHPAWGAWRDHKDELRAARFSLGKEYGGFRWELTHWQAVEGQFEADCALLISLVSKASRAAEEAKEAMKIDFVAEHYAPLVTQAAAKLFAWQKPSCMRLVDALKHGNALDASQTGAGKTYIALAACAELGLTPFVIAPLAVLPAWKRAAEFMGVPLGDVTNYDKARMGSASFIAKNKEANRHKHERTFAFNPRQTNGLFGVVAEDFKPVLIYDECQKVKNHTSLQGQMMADTALQGCKILALSATAAKDPTEMYSIGLALGLHEGGESFNAWAIKYGCRKSGFGIKFTDNPRAAADILGRLHRTIFPSKGTRIRSADVPDYPENNVSASLIDSKEIVQAYEKLDDDLAKIEADYLNGGDAVEQGARTLAAITKARRASELGKLDWIVEETQELLADGNQVVIFLNFREHLAIVRDALKLGYPPVWGTAWIGKRQEVDEETGYSRWVDIDGPAQKPEDRQALIDDFQNGKKRVLLVSLQAGGAGISLHDVNGIAPRHAIISPSYSAIDLVQAVGRIWRAGSKSKATQRIVYAAGTIEEEIAASVTSKIANIESINDGDLLPDCLAKFTKAS